MLKRSFSAALVLSLAACGGCSGLKVGLVDTSVRKPSNIALYFTVDTRSGEPVADLTPQDFHVYEDGKPISLLESRQTILQKEVAAVHYTLLLVDMSGSVVGSGEMPALISAASSFADRVGPYQKVAVYTFDGSPHVNQVAPFGSNVRGAVGALASYRPRDPSTNLNGAIVDAVKVLSRQMESAPQPLRFGTLVVFTDGTDRAHRVSTDDVRRTLDAAAFDIFVIGVGAEVDKKELGAIGRSGTFASQDSADIARGFDQVAARIEGASKRFYLLSYCSPSRAGDHDLEVEVVARGQSGRLKRHFTAAGFAPGCDPAQKPAFDVRHPRFRLAQEQQQQESARPPPSAPPPKQAKGAPPATSSSIFPNAHRPPPSKPSSSSSGVPWNPRR
jgi:hypothetical protein